jgi:hypothetical protein
MYDKILANFLPDECEHGCANWADLKADGNSADQAHSNAKWAAGKAPLNASRHCAMPSLDPGTYTGWCYCKDETSSSQYGYCSSPLTTPTQINLQIAGSPSEVVVSFVTFETMESKYTPQVQISPDSTFPADKSRIENGICHHFTQSGGSKKYAMHFVKVDELKERSTYYYRVRSSATAQWTDGGSFKSLYSSGETNYAVFGDMGLYSYNNMGGLKQDLEDGVIDFAVHVRAVISLFRLAIQYHLTASFLLTSEFCTHTLTALPLHSHCVLNAAG